MTARLPDEPLSLRELSAFLGVSFRTVQRWVADKKIKSTITTQGGHHRFSAFDADNIRRKMCHQRARPAPKPSEPDIFS